MEKSTLSVLFMTSKKGLQSVLTETNEMKWNVWRPYIWGKGNNFQMFIALDNKIKELQGKGIGQVQNLPILQL